MKFELMIGSRQFTKDIVNLMKCIIQQEKDNKAILYIGCNFKKVILPYEEYEKMCQRLKELENKRRND